MTAHGLVREAISRAGRSLFARRFTHASSGNISVKVDDGWLVTPTNASLGDLAPESIAHICAQGHHQSGGAASKEWFFHRACYEMRPSIGAVVHLHSTYAAAVSCLTGLDHANCLPPLTAYQVMRLGKIPVVPFFRPGDPALAAAVGSLVRRHTAVLLANHGPVVAGRTLEAAVHAAEELEESARLFLLLQGQQCRPLSSEQIEEVSSYFPLDPELRTP